MGTFHSFKFGGWEPFWVESFPDGNFSEIQHNLAIKSSICAYSMCNKMDFYKSNVTLIQT